MDGDVGLVEEPSSGGGRRHHNIGTPDMSQPILRRAPSSAGRSGRRLTRAATGAGGDVRMNAFNNARSTIDVERPEVCVATIVSLPQVVATAVVLTRDYMHDGCPVFDQLSTWSCPSLVVCVCCWRLLLLCCGCWGAPVLDTASQASCYPLS